MSNQIIETGLAIDFPGKSKTKNNKSNKINLLNNLHLSMSGINLYI